MSIWAQKHLSHEVSKSYGESASSSILIFGVQVELMNVEKKVLCKGFRVGYALKNTVHKASITQVIQTS